MKKKIIVRPMVNLHTHLREVEEKNMRAILENCIRGGADTLLWMPNLGKEIVTAEQAVAYQKAVERHVPIADFLSFMPTIMLNEHTSFAELEKCKSLGVEDVKVYPRFRTTKSENGVIYYEVIIPQVQHCGKIGIRVHLHPENPWMLHSNRDAELAFLEIAAMLLRTGATIVWEHGTDARCIPYWKEMAKSGRFYLTLTAHHLATNEDETFGDVRAVCKPSIKTRNDQMSLIDLVAENHPWVMAGLDDAPHPVEKKHVHVGKCACGAYTAPFGLQLYAHALLPRVSEKVFANFTSDNARQYYGFPFATRMVTLVYEKDSFQIPTSYEIGSWTVEPFWAGQTLDWTIRG